MARMLTFAPFSGMSLFNQQYRMCNKLSALKHLDNLICMYSDVFFRINAKPADVLVNPPSARANENRAPLKVLIEQCMLSDDGYTLDAGLLEDKLFPAPQRMIFISHLHQEKEKAKQIKEIIEEHCRGITCFIDSDVWDNVYYVTQQMQMKYAEQIYKEQPIYSLTDCNDIAKHMYLILSMALQKAITKSLAFLFIKPDENAQSSSFEVYTYSPWVCHEVLVSSLMPEVQIESKSRDFTKVSSLKLKYPLNLDHLRVTSLNEFINILNKIKK